jgi:transcription elongation factor GreA
MQKELISEQGFQCFVKEFNQLLKVEKPHWVKEKEIAAAFGDRSENAEYLAAKEMLRNIDKRLRFLKKIIDHSTVVQTHTLNHEKVNFGSEVTLLDLQTEEEKTYIILGTYETNPSLNIISNKSPLGKVLLGRCQADEIELQIQGEVFEYEIIHIEMAMI